MLENEKLVNARKKNMKLFVIYRALSKDAIFFYAIKLLFLTQIRKIPTADVIFSISIFAFSIVIWQIPATLLIKKIGYKKSAFLNNLFNIFYITILMFSSSVIHLCIAEFVSAVTFALKDVSDPSLLNASIPETEKRGAIYSKIEGKGVAGYYFIDAITAVLSGFIYAFNPYLPFILSIVFSAISCVISLLFEETVEAEPNKKEQGIKEINRYMKDIKQSVTFIFKSKRLRSLILYSGFAWAFMSIMSDYREALLKDIGTSPALIGIMYAVFQLSSSIASRIQGKFHDMFRNRSLSIIIISCAISMIFTGAIVMFGAPFKICLICILICGIIRQCDNAMCTILTRRYLGNFTNKRIISKIYMADSIVKNIARSMVTMLASALLTFTTTATAMTIVGIIFLISSIAITIYMKPRVGLKPEEYAREEIKML